MKKKALILLLLISMSFSALHALVIEAMDTHLYTQSEHFLSDKTMVQNEGVDEVDICHIDHLFHIAFILPDLVLRLDTKHFSQTPRSVNTIYEYKSYDNFLKPPIHI